MSPTWSGLLAQLNASMMRGDHQCTYQQLAKTHPNLRPWPDPAALLSFLHAPNADPERKGAALHALLAAIHANPARRAPLVTLMLLALWPGLDALRNRLCRYYRGQIDVLNAELLGRLSDGVLSADPVAVRRVAATLLRNLERDMRRMLIRANAVRQLSEPRDTLEGGKSLCIYEQRDDVAKLALRVSQAIGADGPLVVAVTLLGLSQKHAGAVLGLSHDAARKRYQRAIARLDKTYALSCSMSHSDDQVGFSSV